MRNKKTKLLFSKHKMLFACYMNTICLLHIYTVCVYKHNFSLVVLEFFHFSFVPLIDKEVIICIYTQTEWNA